MAALAPTTVDERQTTAAAYPQVLDVCLIYTNTNTQGRLGTHAFDFVLPPLGLGYRATALEKIRRSICIADIFPTLNRIA